MTMTSRVYREVPAVCERCGADTDGTAETDEFGLSWWVCPACGGVQWVDL